MFFSSVVLDTISTIASESSDAALAATTDNLSNDEDTVKSVTSENKNEEKNEEMHNSKIVDDPSKLDSMAASVLVDIQSQGAKPDLKNDLQSNPDYLDRSEVPTKKGKKENKAMSSQTMLNALDKCNDAVTLLETCMDGKKKISTSHRDIHLALKTLKKVTKDMETAASVHLSSYDRNVRKRKRVQEEDEFQMKRCKSEETFQIRARLNCKSYIDNVEVEKSQENEDLDKKPPARSASSKTQILKGEKEINIPSPKSGVEYLPKEFVECLIHHVEPHDRRYVIKEVIKMKLIPLNDFCTVLRHIQNYKKGHPLP